MNNKYNSIKEVFSELVKQYSDPTCKNELGQTLIFKDYTWNINDLESLAIKGFDINSTDNFGKTPLFYCNDRLQFRLLLMRGASINHVDNFGQSILFSINDPENIKLLLRLSVDKSIVDYINRTFLSHELFHTFPTLFNEHLEFAKNKEIEIFQIFENTHNCLKLLHSHDIKIRLAKRIDLKFNPLSNKFNIDNLLNSLRLFQNLDLNTRQIFTFHSDAKKICNFYTLQQLEKIKVKVK